MRARAVAGALGAAALLCGPVAAQDMRIDPAITEGCLSVNAATPEACIGVAATVCMNEPGGSSTIGMGACLGSEAELWDRRLNAAYTALRRSQDAGSADALQAAQRAWIAFRDLSCAYERTTWGGGTGAGPAVAQCLMQMTARQALALEARLEEAR